MGPRMLSCSVKFGKSAVGWEQHPEGLRTALMTLSMSEHALVLVAKPLKLRASTASPALGTINPSLSLSLSLSHTCCVVVYSMMSSRF